MKRILLLCFVFLGLVGSAWAQQAVTGKVTDAGNGEPLPGVAVRVKNTSTGVVTDMDGNYRVEVPSATSVLVFSFIGYNDVEKVVGNQSTINTQLSENVEQLEAVVITAYGQQEKKAFTGAASTVDAKAIESRPITSFESALQGTASGVQVNAASGQPGASPSINIRGVGSLNGSTEPLYVVDGVPVASGNYSSLLGAGGLTSNVMASINPNDIESITILKDASAAALYGSRAANGVVVITTKSGKRGDSRINFSAAYGVSDLAVDQHEVLDATQYFRLYYDANYKKNLAAGQSAADAANAANTQTINNLGINPYNTTQVYGLDASGNVVMREGAKLLWDTDWRDEVINRGVTQNYGIDVSGGSEKLRYFISGGYFDQEGLVPNTNFTRYSGRFSLDTDVTSFLKAGINTSISYSDQNHAPNAGGAANPIRFANLVSNVYPLYERDAEGNIVLNPDGTPAYYYDSPIVLDFNAVGNSFLDTYQTENIRSLNNFFVEASFLKNFKFRTKLAVDFVNVKENLYYNPEHGNGAGVNGRAQQYYNRDIITNITNTLNYNVRLNNVHNIDVLVGQEAWKSHYTTLEATKVDFPVPGLEELGVGTTPQSAFSSFSDERISSLFSRVNYSLLDRYYLTASVRRDGASPFGENNRFGTFWSVGGSWVISEEQFAKDLSFLSMLKLRASYGTTGSSQGLGRYAALGLIQFGNNYNGEPGSVYAQLGNPDLTWENSKNLDLGIEFGFLKNRITGSFVRFDKRTEDLLYAQPLSRVTGFTGINSNIASIRNSGYEVEMNFVIVSKSDLQASLGFNLTTLDNEILSLGEDEFFIDGTKRWEVGGDRFEYFIQEFAGVDPADGAPMWYKDILNAEGNPTGRETTKSYAQATRYEQGSALPDFYGGLRPQISYKGFDLSAIVSFSMGNKIYDFTYADIMHAGANNGQQLSVDILDAWQKPGDVTDVPVFNINNASNFNRTSSRFLFDGDYARVKNITLSYNVPANWTSRAFMKSARVYVSAENAFTFAKHKGMDPELPVTGNSNNFYPTNRTITFGVNVGL